MWIYLCVVKLNEAKEQFILNWGALGTQWGINKTMAQIHALLLVSPDPLSTEDIMNQLQISRGNANMNLRELMDWGIVEKVLKTGERKEFFLADKDIWKVAMRIIKERKKREIDPIIRTLQQLQEIDDESAADKDKKQFQDTVKQIEKLANQASGGVESLVKMDENWFTGTLLKIFR